MTRGPHAIHAGTGCPQRQATSLWISLDSDFCCIFKA